MYSRHLALVASLATTVVLGLEMQNTTNKPSTSRWPSGQHLATDYYPSQWPESTWDSDMAAMVKNNISMIRINEFDWSILEPSEGEYNFTLLDKTLDLCSKHGLKAIVGTPTATPPDWVMTTYPDVSFVDRTNQTLLFGSRRHYSPSSFSYRKLSASITQKLSSRYGSHPAVAAWQLDNEFGCHDTIRSYDPDAITRFRAWLEAKYETIENLNSQQGRVFWSSQYSSFQVIQPPFLEVYTTNQAHTKDWYEFSSDSVISFASEQSRIIRQNAPTQAITTNFMVLFTDFDHFKFARQVGLDFVTFDSYPLAGPSGFTSLLTTKQLASTLRTGLPDLQALVHALYRGVSGAAYGNDSAGGGPFGVMEMQPGVLNWNAYRVSPWPGMVKLWSLETFAASGDLVNYFRWRQVPFAQEQTLSGLHRTDFTEDEGLEEIRDMVRDGLPQVKEESAARAAAARRGEIDDQEEGKGKKGKKGKGKKGKVALVFDYTASWTWSIEPYSGTWDVQAAGYDSPAVGYTDLVYIFYSALRRLGLSVDVVGPEQSLEGYEMVVVPSMPILSAAFQDSLRRRRSFESGGPVVIFGPHTGSRTENFEIVKGLNPGAGSAVDERLPMRVTRVETPPSYAGSGVSVVVVGGGGGGGGGGNYSIDGREEWIECHRGERKSRATVLYTSPHRRGNPAAACEKDDVHYLAFKPSVEMLIEYLGDVAAEKGMVDLFGRKVDKKNDLGESVRVLGRGDLVFVFNYGTEDVEGVAVPKGGKVVSGQEGGKIEGAGVVIYDVSGNQGLMMEQ